MIQIDIEKDFLYLEYEIFELLKVFGKKTSFIVQNQEENFKEKINIYSNNNLVFIEFFKNNITKKFSIEIEKGKKEIKNFIKRTLYCYFKDNFEVKVPWGILTGIRPTKIIHELRLSGKKEDEIKQIMKEKYYLDDDKIDLLVEVAKKEKYYLDNSKKNTCSIYISIPFCPTRCIYCSFPSHNLKQWGKFRKEYVEKLKSEISQTLPYIKKDIETIYIGGGTPTSLEAQELESLLSHISSVFDLNAIKEFTVEAGRVDTITKEKLEILKKYKVSRISINPQTMNDKTLNLIKRDHDHLEINRIFKLARKVGFDNINMDIILGLPQENAKDVKITLERILNLNPESLTVHTMAIKRASKLKENLQDYNLSLYEEMINMLNVSKEFAKKMKLEPYYMYRQKYMLGNLENIGYSKEGKECIYNIQIMEEKQDIIAFGAGAVSKFTYPEENRLERVANVKNLLDYLNRTEEMVLRKKKYL